MEYPDQTYKPSQLSDPTALNPHAPPSNHPRPTIFPQQPAKTFEEYNPFSQNFNSELQPRNNEVSSHYRHRKAVYDAVLNDLKDHEKAVCYSNIWSNKIYLGVKYPAKLEEIVMKYSPKT